MDGVARLLLLVELWNEVKKYKGRLSPKRWREKIGIEARRVRTDGQRRTRSRGNIGQKINTMRREIPLRVAHDHCWKKPGQNQRFGEWALGSARWKPAWNPTIHPIPCPLKYFNLVSYSHRTCNAFFTCFAREFEFMWGLDNDQLESIDWLALDTILNVASDDRRYFFSMKINNPWARREKLRGK